MKVLKFGGTSLGSADALRNVLEIILSAAKQDRIAVVVSALSGVTDQLIRMSKEASSQQEYKTTLAQLEKRHIEMAKEFTSPDNIGHITKNIKEKCTELEQILKGISLVGEVSPKTLDLVMSFGERLSAFLVTELIRPNYAEAKCLDARSVIQTDDSFGQAIVDMEKTRANINAHFEGASDLQIITGFIGRGPKNEPTTLGRGGSDYTAAIFAASLSSEVVEIWTDVDGVMTADPRKVRKAFTIPQMSYEEAMELSHFGAKVIYPPTMQPTLDAGIPIHIRNTLNPTGSGTIISLQKPSVQELITGISSISNITILRIEGSGLVGISGMASRLFGALASKDISVILISQASSEHSICLAIKPEEVETALAAIRKEFDLELRARYIEDVIVEDDRSIVAVVGGNMRAVAGISGRLFQALGKNGINVTTIAQGSSELNISVVISRKDEAKALASLHDAFFLSELTSINLFLVGPGSVGKTLIKQLSEHQESLRRKHHFDVRLIGLADSKKMVIDENSISLTSWEKVLSSSSLPMNITQFVEQMNDINLPNSIFIDCTANETIATCYEQVLDASISIVTPNKRANSGSWQRYIDLKDKAKKANVKYFYETTVGAGLPVISTLNDLQNSGDTIVRIEAVLSGTLSYIFNTFTPDREFSEVVRQAAELGYTEPDPRDDLSGTDVMRKLLILAREIGTSLEENEITIESLISDDCIEADSVETFLGTLKKHDAAFKSKQQKATQEGKVLRYIAAIEGRVASVSLQAVDTNHPFYSLSGSDNIVSITTSRYTDRPLVVKGPGAGTSVTAAGIFADIFKVATYLR